MLKAHNAKLLISAVNSCGYPVHESDEIVMLGRSNVGKSTFINKICNRKNLAYTSSKPGKTQLLNFFYINDDLTIVDVPGYGYAKVSQKRREEFGKMIEEYLTTRDNLKLSVLLIDFKVGPTEDDILMFEFLKYFNKKVLVVATKKDKVKKSSHHKHKKNILEKLLLSEEDKLVIYSNTDENTVNNICDIINTMKESYE